MEDSKTSFDFIRVQSKLNKLVDDFMYETGKTAVRIRPPPQTKEVIMIGTLIVMIMFLYVFSLAAGAVIAKIFWTPPGQE